MVDSLHPFPEGTPETWGPRPPAYGTIEGKNLWQKTSSPKRATQPAKGLGSSRAPKILQKHPSPSRILDPRRYTKGERITKRAVKSLLNPKQKFAIFNRLIDRDREDTKFSTFLPSIMRTLTNNDLLRLIKTDPVHYRGYDRMALADILIEAKTVILEREISDKADLKALSQFCKHLKNTRVITVDDKYVTELGGGAVNTVYSITTTQNGEKVEGVFKPDTSELGLGVVLKEQMFGTAAASGIPPGEEAHLSYRSVASSVVDQLLFDENPISVKTEFAIVNGRRGILMQKAPGKSPEVKQEVTETINLENHPEIKQYIDILRQNKSQIESSDLKLIAAMLKFRRVELKEETPGEWSLEGTRKELGALNPDNPTTAEGLLKLEVKDKITGQCDRHPQNYFIDDAGNVMGIDEDCSFGVNALPEHGDVRRQPALKGIIPNNASLMVRMPPVITAQVKARIDHLHQNLGDDLKEKLKFLLTPQEIEATLNRLERLFNHVNSEKCLVVEDKQALLLPDSKKRMNTNNSYLMRELLVYDSDQKGWNYLRAYREY